MGHFDGYLKEFRPRAFCYMLMFTVSDADFRLHSMEGRFPVVELLEQSLDICEDPAFSRLLCMLFCSFGTDVLQPANLKGTVLWVKTIAELSIAHHATGPVSLRCPSDIRAIKDVENIVQYIFVIDFEYWRICANYCLGLKAANMNMTYDKC